MANEKRLELIDRKELVKKMCRACNNECCEDPCEPGECFMYDAISNAPTVDAVEVVRCKDCKCFKPAHFKADDGTEELWDETFSFDGRTDGIYIGGKCKHIRNTAYGEKDMAFRKPDDFCSYGERRTDD